MQLGYTPFDYACLECERMAEGNTSDRAACGEAIEMLRKFRPSSHGVVSDKGEDETGHFPTLSPLKSILRRCFRRRIGSGLETVDISQANTFQAPSPDPVTSFQYAMRRLCYFNDVDTPIRSLLGDLDVNSPRKSLLDDFHSAAEISFVLLLVDNRHPLLAAPYQRLAPTVVLRKLCGTASKRVKLLFSSECRSVTAPSGFDLSWSRRNWEALYAPAAFIGPIADYKVAKAIATAWRKQNRRTRHLRKCTADCDENNGLDSSVRQPANDGKLNAYQEALENWVKCPQREASGPCDYSCVENGIQLVSSYKDFFPTTFWSSIQQLKKSYVVIIPYLDRSNTSYEGKRKNMAQRLTKLWQSDKTKQSMTTIGEEESLKILEEMFRACFSFKVGEE